ncbi:alpha/beta fold hydrolase [Acetatifactor aquisgranensis]|uniref:alpha/beta fold hydrolase n=1 Tax=Acetatifactor aquisgranensis TaxID=2941233 RepID=UPI00203C7BE1|nr:alpha/beta hydrolase [Acetatifactor aquisgranensis]
MNVVFLHGLGQSPSSWNETISCLSEDIKAYCPNLFDFSTDRAITYKNIYLSFEEYIDRFSEPVTICGISLGAVLALNYCINHAEKVLALILIAPQYKIPGLLLKFQNIIFRIMPEKSFGGSGIKKQDMIHLTSSMVTLNFEQDLGNILCPTLIICGERDLANVKAAKTLAKNILGAKLCLIDNAGHEINVTAPKRLANAMSDFMSQ